ALAYPDATKAPILGPSLLPFQDRWTYLAAFKPDACDPRPCPVHTFVADGGTLPDNEAQTVACDPVMPTDCNCYQNPENPGTVCEWTIENRFRLAPLAGASLPTPGTPVHVGLRWCACPFDTSTLQGRVACRWHQYCPVDEDWSKYDHPGTSGNPWLELATEAGPAWSSKAVGHEFALDLSEESVTVTWDFLDLPPGKFHAEYDGAALLNASARGVLDATVQDVNGFDPGSSEWRRRTHFFGPGNPRAEIGVSGGTTFLLSDDLWHFVHYCPECPQGFTRLVARVNDPQMYRAIPSGLVTDASVASDTRALYDEFAAGALKYVPVSEALGTLATLTPVGRRLLRGVALDATVTVAKEVTSDGIMGAPTAALRATGGGTPELLGDEAVVLSGWLRRLFVVGGTVDGTLDGVPNVSGWMLDVDVNQWVEYPLVPTARPGVVLGAAFHAADAGIYLVDHTDGELRLRRWRPGDAMTTVGTLPHAWQHYERSWLVAGADGELLFAATKAEGCGGSYDAHDDVDDEAGDEGGHGDGDHGHSQKSGHGHGGGTGPGGHGSPGGGHGNASGHGHGHGHGDDGHGPQGPRCTLLARLDVDFWSRVTFGGVLELDTRILAEPIAGHGAVSLVVPHASGARLLSVGLEGLHDAPPGQRPDFSP
ncbi:MAG: hypothetical protein IT373_02800, partial [Polyangiaceae bacterium]|nr:hypothetical protein [Polyangiaceae bacterium]